MANLRVLFYCHNVIGLGHIARSLRIAEALPAGTSVTIVTGCRFLDRLEVPESVAVERLPALRVDGAGRLHAAEGAPGDAVERRPRDILAFCDRWRPHAVVVDQRPMGLAGELVPTLERAAVESWETRFIWGIPYLERAGFVVPRPRNPRLLVALSAYDSAMVYDDESLDVATAYRDYGLPEAVVHVGLVAAPVRAPLVGGPVACLCGGGTGGAELFELVVVALARLEQAPPVRFVVGPFGNVDHARTLVDDSGLSAEVWQAGSVAEATADAALVVARCGYNTAAALIGSPLPVIFVPLHKREDEQLRRARRFAELDGVWSVDDARADASERLAAAVDEGLARGVAPRSLPFALDGAERAATWICRRAGEAQRLESA